MALRRFQDDGGTELGACQALRSEEGGGNEDIRGPALMRVWGFIIIMSQERSWVFFGERRR